MKSHFPDYPRLLVAILFMVALGLLAGCGQPSDAFSTAGARSASQVPSLRACVLAWDRASFGEGLRSAAIDAVSGQTALMFAFGNGACGLAFAAHTTNAFGEQRGTYVSYFGGDFTLRYSPLGYVSKSEITKLRADASRHTNVIVQRKSGRVTALPRSPAHMLTVPASVFISSPDCKYAIPSNSLTSGRYRILRNSISCAKAQTLLWGWAAAEGSTEHPEAQYIVGWACVGTKRLRGVMPISYEIVTCTSGANVVEAKNELRQMWK